MSIAGEDGGYVSVPNRATPLQLVRSATVLRCAARGPARGAAELLGRRRPRGLSTQRYADPSVLQHAERGRVLWKLQSGQPLYGNARFTVALLLCLPLAPLKADASLPLLSSRNYQEFRGSAY